MTGLRPALAMFAWTWRKTIRRPVVLSFSLLQPLVWMLFFGFLFQRYDLTDAGYGADVRYLDFLVPGICAMTVLFAASQSGVNFIRDMQTGFFERLLTTPAPPAALLAGKVGADTARALAQAAAVLALGALLGARIAPSAALLAGFGCLGLFGAGFASLSCWIAFKARSPERMATFVHAVNMPLVFTSTALVPDKGMPDWLAAASAWNPLTRAVDPMRSATLGLGGDPLPALGFLAIVALGLFALAVTGARLETR